jgi:hypothetical protein
VLPGTLYSLNCPPHVADIVQGIENPEHIHSVFGSLLDKPVDYSVLVMSVTQEVLPAEQHLQA